MSSTSRGRYQSRLFNFLNRQSIRLSDRFDRTVRQLKVAATWGVQILLYPVYLVTQAGLSAGRQLSSAAQAGQTPLKAFTQSQPQETPPAADTPIQRVLEEVSTLEFNVETLDGGKVQNQLPTHQPDNRLIPQPATPLHLSETNRELSEQRCLIQGVASQLATRSLVLVTVQNQILDILTQEQQQKLSARITWEVADLLRHWRLAQALERQFPHRLAELDRPRVFLPVRLFWQLMAWVQTSPVAIAANVFQESVWVPSPELNVGELKSWNVQNNPSTYAPLTAKQGVLAFLDSTVAELESHQLVPGSEAVVVLYERASLSMRDRTDKLLQKLQASGRPTESLESPQANPSRIQALIYAAVDYFFGRRGSNLPNANSQEQLAIPANSQQQLYQLPGRDSTLQSPLIEGKHSESQAQLSEAVNVKTPVIGNSVWSAFKRYLNLNQPLAKRSQPSPQSIVETANLKTPSPDAVSSPNTSSLPATEASQADTFRIQALIYAAIDYFFGRRRSHLPQTASPARSAIPASPQVEPYQLSGRDSNSLPPGTQPDSGLADAIEPDPWLSWDDLFGHPNAAQEEINYIPPSPSTQGETPKSSTQLPEAFNSTAVQPGNSVWSAIKRYLRFKPSPGKLSAPNTGEQSIERPPSVQSAKLRVDTEALPVQIQDRYKQPAATQHQTPFPTAASSPSTSVSPATTTTTAITNPSTPSSDSPLEPAPDWIETQATPAGYVKHPLEQLLVWLDLGMLWLEELIVKLWQWIARAR